MTGPRHPGSVPDDPPPLPAPPPGLGSTIGPDGVDTDGDARPDTLLTDDGVDLLVLSDLDADGRADRLLRIGPDGVVRESAPPSDQDAPGASALDGLLGGADAGWEP